MPLRLNVLERLLARLNLLPVPLFDTPLAPGITKALVTACELGVFEALSAQPLSLDDLAKPAAGLRRIDPIGICRRALHVVHLPAGKVGTADVPFVALAICGQDECAFACTCQNSYLAHALLLVKIRVIAMRKRD